MVGHRETGEAAEDLVMTQNGKVLAENKSWE
jgi:hypothetical protein